MIFLQHDGVFFLFITAIKALGGGERYLSEYFGKEKEKILLHKERQNLVHSKFIKCHFNFQLHPCT